jgi:hypothetical protein
MSIPTTLSDYGASILIERNGVSRLILKQHIKDITIIENKLIIDYGAKAKVVIPFNDIVAPPTENLITVISNWTDTVAASRQGDLIAHIDSLNAALQNINGGNESAAMILRWKDETRPDIQYYGYSSAVNTQMDDDSLSIQKTNMDNGTTKYEWADGQRLGFVHNWDNREEYSYQ